MSEDLPVLRPDSARSARTIARCRARLEAQRRKLEQDGLKPARNVGAAERFVLAGACFAYLVSMAAHLLKTIDPR